MEIERKFLVKNIPDLSNITPIRYERYYLKRGDGIEERIQKKGEIFEYEIKKEVSKLERTANKKIITEEEFDKLKQNSSESILRDSYKLSNNLSIKIYHGRFEGLIRAEIEFETVELAKVYQSESWMGDEITDSPLGRDSKLLDLSDPEFHKLLSKFNAGI